jgi:hypothetical protein
VLTVDFRSKTGTVRHLQTTSPITGIQLRQTADGPKFSASFANGTHSGRFEATVFAKYELEVEITGTARTSVNAHPTEIEGGDNDVGSLSTADKLQEAIRRALPQLPDEVAREIEAIFTPPAIAIMAGMAGLWAASHLAVVGEIADVALLITGGLLLGRAAWDVGSDLSEFIVKATGADSQEDLDEAAQHFAAAVLKGGPVLVGTLSFSKGAQNTWNKLRPPVKPGEIPAGRNLVPPSKLPPASRAPSIIQGEQPNLAGVAPEKTQLVRGLLNKIRSLDLIGKGMDCCEGCEALGTASGGKGIVRESTSGHTPHVPGIEHTMWEIGGEFVDTRPGMWREIFRRNPAARAAMNRALPGLAERLENGAVLTPAEHNIYQGRTPVPRSNMFDAKPVRRPGLRQ